MTSLTFLTWNLALLKRSAQAPIQWSQDSTEAAFRELVLHLSPDIILLQELPRMVPFVETHGMIRANPLSHSGNLATLVKHELLLTEPPFSVIDGCAILTTFDDVTIANVHLAPGPGRQSEGQRLEQFADIVEASPTEKIVIVGDTNTRVSETEALANADLIGEQPPRPTWDSQKNRFNDDSVSGSPKDQANRSFRAYFTRWFASPGVTVSDVKVLDKPIEHDGKKFHISDHYALTGTITTSDTGAAA